MIRVDTHSSRNETETRGVNDFLIIHHSKVPACHAPGKPIVNRLRQVAP